MNPMNKTLTVLIGEKFYKITIVCDDLIQYNEYTPFNPDYSKGITPKFDHVETACVWAKHNFF